MNKQYYVYIMTNKRNNVLKYNITRLVFYEPCEDVKEAILREKKIKGGSRTKKIGLVDSMNKERRDLYEDII